MAAFQPALNLFAGFVNASFMKSNITVLPAEPLSVVPAEIPHQVKQWKSQRPDVFIGNITLTAVEEVSHTSVLQAAQLTRSQPLNFY